MRSAMPFLFVLLLGQSAFSSLMPSDSYEPKSVSLTTEPLAILFGDFHIQSEFRLSDLVSLLVPVGIFNTNWAPFKLLTTADPEWFTGVAFTGWIAGAGVGVKLYPLTRGIGSGLYTQLTVFGGVGQTYALNQLLGMILQKYAIGYTWVAGCGFVLDLYGGFAQFNFSQAQGQGFLPTAGLALGYAF